MLLSSLVALAIAFGGPAKPPPLRSISEPFEKVDLSDLPPVQRVAARDGTQLAFRRYPAAAERAKGSVVLVHGSSAGGISMHVLARAFAAAGYEACALDVRGHGESGTKGFIDYVGQLEDDLEDFCRAVAPARPSTLVGFSSGGGFALRFAGSSRQELFSGYVLLSPFISQDAPTYRPGGGGWVRVGVPRLVAISLLRAIGVHAFDRLPTMRFALDDAARAFLTSEYSCALAENFRPERDYRANIRAVRRPLRLVAGRDDEVFYADRFAALFEAERKQVPVTLVPGLGHVTLTLEPAGVHAVVSAVAAASAA